jgi:hypothetical protein
MAKKQKKFVWPPAEVVRQVFPPAALKRYERRGEEELRVFARPKGKTVKRRASKFRAPPTPPGVGLKPTKKRPQPPPEDRYVYTIPKRENIQKFVTRPVGVFDFRYSTPGPWCKTDKMEKGRCAVQLNFKRGRPVLAFCTAPEEVGEVAYVNDVDTAVLVSREGCGTRAQPRLRGLRGLGRGHRDTRTAAEVRAHIKAVRACMRQTRHSKRVCELQVTERRR